MLNPFHPRTLIAFSAAFSSAAFTCTVHAQAPATGAAFPTKPIRIVVPAAPGGGTDILSRLLSPKLTEILGQSMIIENRAGASTNIGTEFVARSAPDGYTLLMATTPHAVNPSLFAKLNFDPLRDFTMISQLPLS
jgi:tripartite-type tricarboxylate transporter receptor subunit TctC